MAQYYRFKIGSFDCCAISDGELNYRPDRFFSNAPKDEVEAILHQHGLPTEHVTTPYTCLFVDTGTHRVMVDVGGGNMAPSTGFLVSNMQAAGIEPDSIDTIIITHAHPDHIGGNLDADGNPIYTNARYHICKDEWAFWTSEDAVQQAPERHVVRARKQLTPVVNRLEQVECESTIVPGIGAIEAPGHTPGHMVLLISSDGERLMHISDTVLYPLHLEYPNLIPIYDILPEQAAISKQRIFDKAADEQLLIFAHHFPPFPNLGYVTRTGDGWLWQPIEIDG